MKKSKLPLPVHGDTFCIYVLLVLLTSINSSTARAATAILTGDNNKEPNICQAAFGASWLTSAITSKVAPPTPTGQAVKFGADTSAYLFNMTLKLCPPSIVAPDIVKKHPKSTSSCIATFNQPVTSGEYENWNGIPTSHLWGEAKDRLGVSSWGELGRPLVYHFNTSADVRMVDPTKVPGAEDDAWLPDANGNIALPVGRNLVTWRADSMMALTDLTPLFLIPLVAPGDKIAKKLVMKNRRLSETVYKTYGRLTRYGDGGRVRNAVSKFIVKKVADAVEDMPATVVEKVLDKGVGLDWRTSYLTGLEAYNTVYQEVWVYDTIPPTLATSKNSAAFPSTLQPLLDYDADTDTYYLEAFAPRIADFTIQTYGNMLLTADDACQGRRPSLKPIRIDAPLRNYWVPGDQGTLRWQVADSGPKDEDGGVNLSNEVEQKFELRDSNPPILIAPPSKVVEIPATSASTTVTLGSPRVFDLADLTPSISNDAPLDTSFNVGINTVTWTSVDYSGNAASDEQLINVKYEGTNTAPVGYNQVVSAISYQPVDIILESFDSDFDPGSGRYDPLSFTIKDKPNNGFFVAPLLPYFIDDYRLEASALRFAGELDQEDPGQYCKDLNDGLITGPDKFQIKYPYRSEWFSVDDDGITAVYDQGDMACGPSGDLETRYRLAMFDAAGDLLRYITADSTLTNIYIDWRSMGVYTIDNIGPGEPNNITFYDKELNWLGSFKAEYIDSLGFSQRITGDASITADAQGIVYVVGTGTGAGDVVAYQGPTSESDLGSHTTYKFLGVLHSDGNFRDIATDTENNVYVSRPDRILKFAASSVNDEGKLVPGAFIGWMGQCETNLTSTYACDTVNQRSIGFSCSDTLCGTTGSNYGSEPAQFNNAKGIAVDPNDILYVSDYGNSRVQRFTPEGDFAGEANSTGAGYGFILGDFGRPEDITVNSDHFYILNRNLLHVLQTTPVTPIDDTTAKVTYQSDNNFVGTDSFSFEATDGLDSATGIVTVNVERDYRPPEIHAAPAYTLDEDGTVSITLVGTDPDGVLDTLSYIIVEPPRHGSLSGIGENIIYTPDADYYGDDSFSYQVNDGVYDSDTAIVNLTITAVEDAPQVATEADLNAGLGFTLQLPVDVYDPDADEALMVSIDWGDGSAIEYDGVIMQGGVVVTGDYIQPDGTLPDDTEATGPLLNLNSDGKGSVIFEHIYTANGDHMAEICVTDRAETLSDGTKQPTLSSQTTCTQTVFSVALIADLVLIMEAEASDVDPGTSQLYTINVTNRQFDADVPAYPTGLDVANLMVSGEHGNGLSLAIISTSRGTCNIDQGMFNCSLGSLAYSETATIEIEGSVDPLAPGNALLTLTANRTADAIPLLEEEGIGVVQVNASGRPPTAELLSDSAGLISGGMALTVTGNDFDVDADVLFDNLPATEVEVVDSTTINLITPAHTAGTVDVVVVNSDGQSSTLANAYRYLKALPVGVGEGDDSGGDSIVNINGGGGGGSQDIFSIILMLLLWKSRQICRSFIASKRA